MSESANPDCPFCNIAEERIILCNTLALVVLDAFPVSAGHTLVIPRRHVSSVFDLMDTEITTIYELLRAMRTHLQRSFSPDGFTVGINVGTAAGQTVAHAHVHLIPRYAGDVTDPEGGVRNIIPGKGRYREVDFKPEEP